MGKRLDIKGKLACSWIASCEEAPRWVVKWNVDEVSYVCAEHLKCYRDSSLVDFISADPMPEAADAFLAERVAELSKEVVSGTTEVSAGDDKR